MALNWCKSKEVLQGSIFCLQFVALNVCVYFKYWLASTFIEMLSQTSLLFFLFSPGVFLLKFYAFLRWAKRRNVSLVE